MTAGYSRRGLTEKLGVKPGTTVTVLGAPAGYRRLLAPVPAGVRFVNRLAAGAGFVHQFARRRSELEAAFPRLARALEDTGTLWVSWPKRAAKVETDLTEDVVRGIGLAAGLVDVKVCAVDQTWSGLKFVRRLRDRKR
ncbi:MAG TPA: DUF3052 domain-containing protein [Gemmatimonadales bacterium]|nr:DUF3052 domain-containing protein [Gemmatimonadales bacterium]